MAHAEMCEEWGYLRLHEAIEAQAKDEMKHAEKLVKRILFLGGMPVMSKLNAIKIGKDVAALLARTQEDEDSAIEAYNRGVKLARECDDESTAHLLGKILRTEERHKDWAERQRLHITQMGLQNYLAQQLVASAPALG
jgi:bacterioferritin